MTEAVINLTALLALTCNVASVGLAGALIGGPRFAWSDRVLEYASDGALALGGLIAVVATAGSLYFSEVADFVPCRYCWFQRIFMYPLAILLPIAAWRRDLGVRWYVLPLATVGLGLSTYHYLLQRFPDLAGGSSCDVTAPCTAAWVWKWDFVSIPYMAGSGFLLIGLLALATIRHREEGPA